MLHPDLVAKVLDTYTEWAPIFDERIAITEGRIVVVGFLLPGNRMITAEQVSAFLRKNK